MTFKRLVNPYSSKTCDFAYFSLETQYEVCDKLSWHLLKGGHYSYLDIHE